ncbi:MAG: hypothetical protein ACKPBF_00585, partial [Actinomycetota bacterium]
CPGTDDNHDCRTDDDNHDDDNHDDDNHDDDTHDDDNHDCRTDDDRPDLAASDDSWCCGATNGVRLGANGGACCYKTRV